MEFEKWRSIPRLSKEHMTITEKIDGSNACIVIAPTDNLFTVDEALPLAVIEVDIEETEILKNGTYGIWAQSRTRFITPDDDNFGFATWVKAKAPSLLSTLGLGRHYGEWWGSKIQRGYGLKERRFSLFNASRWSDTIDVDPGSTSVSELCTVPLLYKGPFDTGQIVNWKDILSTRGSYAVDKYWDAEGIIVELREAGARYKVLLENDDSHKWELSNGQK